MPSQKTTTENHHTPNDAVDGGQYGACAATGSLVHVFYQNGA